MRKVWHTSTNVNHCISDNDVHFPLLRIRHIFDSGINDKLINCDSVIFTSGNAVTGAIKSGIDLKKLSKKTLILVGRRSLEELTRNSGCKYRYEMYETASDIFEAIKDKTESFFYIRGKNISIKSKALKMIKSINQSVVYEAKFINDLPSDLLCMIYNGDICEIKIMSKRSSYSMIRMIKKYKMIELVKKINIDFMSEEIRIYFFKKLHLLENKE